MMKKINSFDMDGVLTVGLFPGPDDVIITGRSIEECGETHQWLRKRGIRNMVFFNPLSFDEKTRVSSGWHKANILNKIHETYEFDVVNHFEDDEVQAAVIERECPWVNVVRIVHDLTEKENVRHFDDK